MALAEIANAEDLAAWMKRMETLPGYAKAYPPHWK